MIVLGKLDIPHEMDLGGTFSSIPIICTFVVDSLRAARMSENDSS